MLHVWCMGIRELLTRHKRSAAAAATAAVALWERLMTADLTIPPSLVPAVECNVSRE